MNRINDIKAFLIDLDGVLYNGNEIIEKAPEAIQYIKNKGYKTLFITNTTSISLKGIHQKLISLGFNVDEEEIFSAPKAAVNFLRKQNNPKCFFVLNDDLKEEFAEFGTDEFSPEYIVAGDIGNLWNSEVLNKVFKMILNGSKLLALHKGKYWLTENGLKFDIGLYVAGLEFVTGKQAIVMGKPSNDFFNTAIQKLNLKHHEVAIIGDNIDTDIGAAQFLGLLGILVRTGKYNEDYVIHSHIRPEVIIDSIIDVQKYF